MKTINQWYDHDVSRLTYEGIWQRVGNIAYMLAYKNKTINVYWRYLIYSRLQ